MFGTKNKNAGLKIEVLEKEVKILEDKVKAFEKLADDAIKTCSNIEKDHAVEMRRKEAELDVRIMEATKDKNQKISVMEIENGNLRKEVEILTKAFSNLGFDVRDMKQILNKLVDGVVSKNTINLVK